MDQRSNDLNPSFRFCPHFYDFVEGLVKNFPAVRITGTVFFHRANIDLRGADDLCPGYGDGEKVGVPEGDVGAGNA